MKFSWSSIPIIGGGQSGNQAEKSKNSMSTSVCQRCSVPSQTTNGRNHAVGRRRQWVRSKTPVLRPKRPTALARRTLVVASGAPNWNPQNVPDPQVMPSAEFGPEDTVKAQLDAMSTNDEPWTNHGIQTMYEFAEDAGGMERSRYFGFSKDLYHFDHFLGGFLNACPEMVNLAKYEIQSVEELPNEMRRVSVKVQEGDSSEPVLFDFILTVRALGRKKGCWMTKALLRLA